MDYPAHMTLGHSKLTSQGQISIPSKIRKRLGLAPGSVIEWHETGDEIVVRRSSRYSSADIHAALFPTAPAKQSPRALKEAIRERMRKRHARPHARD